MKIHHNGIITENIDNHQKLFDNLGFEETWRGDVTEFGIKCCFLQNSYGEKIELIQPYNDQYSLQSFLKEKGEGLHHIAFQTDDIEKEFRRMQDMGLPIIGSKIVKGALDMKVFFIHPKSFGRVLIEIVQPSG